MKSNWMLVVAGVAALGMLTSHASAQLMEGMIGLKAYQAQSTSWPHGTLGYVVVVSSDNSSPPSGMTAGKEHWYWTSGARPSSFRLVAIPWTTDPEVEWTVYDNDEFDLSDTAPFPSISVAPGDSFYEVSLVTSSGSEEVAHFWFHDDEQDAWGADTLTETRLGAGSGEALIFEQVTPPAASSIDVYEVVP